MFWSAEGYCPKCAEDSKNTGMSACYTPSCMRNLETKIVIPLKRHCQTKEGRCKTPSFYFVIMGI